MKIAGVMRLAGIFGIFTSTSTFAMPLDITLTGGTATHYWGDGEYLGNLLEWQEEDVVSVANQPFGAQVNLANVNSIVVTWQAPPGYMYVVKPPPIAFTGNSSLALQFEEQLGPDGQASSLQSVTSSSFSINTVYGTSPISGIVELDNNHQLPDYPFTTTPALDFFAGANVDSGTAPFAFTSMTLSADFSGTGSDVTLSSTAGNGIGVFFGILYGLPVISYGIPFYGPGDPGPLLTLEPLATGGPVPDQSSALGLAALGFGGLVLLGRRFVAGQ